MSYNIIKELESNNSRLFKEDVIKREAEEENKILRKKVLDLQGELGSSYAKIKEIAGIIYAEKIKKNS